MLASECKGSQSQLMALVWGSRLWALLAPRADPEDVAGTI